MTHVDAQASALISGLNHCDPLQVTKLKDYKGKEMCEKLAKDDPVQAVHNAASFGFFVNEKFPSVAKSKL